MAYFNSPDEMFEATGFDLDDIVDEEVEPGKHDCTNYSGYLKDKDGLYRHIYYSCSYNNGIEWIELNLNDKYLQEEVVVPATTYKKV